MEAVVILFASRTYSEIDSMRIPKSLLYGELVFDKRNRSRRKLRFKEVCKRSLKILNITTHDSELLASYRAKWRTSVHKRQKESEKEYFKKPKKIKK